MRPPQTQRRLLPVLVAANSFGIVVLAALIVVAFQLNGDRSGDIEALVCSAHRDKVQRIVNTRIYLRTPTGMERRGTAGGLNRYIREISLPQLESEVAKERERLPASCYAKKLVLSE